MNEKGIKEMKKIFVTRKIPDIGIEMLKNKGYEVTISKESRPLTKKEIIKNIKGKNYDVVLSLLTDSIDSEVMNSAPTVKLYANYAVGFNNIDIKEAQKRGIVVTNTPGGSTERVAEHTLALIFSLVCRVTEGDRFIRSGKFTGFDPMLFWGAPVAGETLGIIGAGRIGSRVAEMAVKGFGMKLVYSDPFRNEALENGLGARYMKTPDEVLEQADIVSLHCSLGEGSCHLINEERLRKMKKNAYIVNTSRGAVIDEKALVKVLKEKLIAGAGLDVFENEPLLSPGLSTFPNVILTPHIASAEEGTRLDMSKMVAQNIIDFVEGRVPMNKVD